MPIEPIVLEGRAVRLEPLHADHAAALWRAATPDLFTYIPIAPRDRSFTAFQAYVATLRSRPSQLQFAIVSCQSGEAVGTTSYMDLRLEHRGLEIGNTWIARTHQGTLINPENKYLLLRHAFETLGMLRVQLKCDARNILSQRAIAKLGAQREGVLRKHVVLPDGFVRDTVLFSITDDEWPQVKAGLEDRLGYPP
jgi:ribosomal-protein-alanine N-acetyltransferase